MFVDLAYFLDFVSSISSPLVVGQKMTNITLVVFVLGSFAAGLFLGQFFAPEVVKVEVKQIPPQPLVDVRSVQYFSLDPQTGSVVYGVDGSKIDHSYLLRLEVKGEKDEYWSSANSPISGFRYRIAIARSGL